MLELPGLLVDPSWLERHLDDVVLLDIRWYLDGRSGRAAYDSGHIPGARFVDLDTDLSGPPTTDGGRHPLPSPGDFASSLGRLGVDNTSVVVVYDDSGGITAGRGWWMLDAVGVAAAVLDGGLDAWAGPTDTNAPQWERTEFDTRPWPRTRLIDKEEVESRCHDSGTVILDARSTERYRGEKHPVDVREGHIPGASSAPAAANLGADGRFLPVVDLEHRYRSLGARDRDVVAYCGSGVSACHDLLAMRVAGLGDGRLFVGSWSAWAPDLDRLVEIGG